MTRPYALGIDIGGSYTGAAAYRDGRAETLKLDPEDDALPSVVYLDGDPTSWPVGSPAIRAARASGADPGLLAVRFTGHLGESDPMVFGDVVVRAQDLMARLLAHAVGASEAALGERPAHVTLTHPGHWGPHTLGVLRVVTEALGIEQVGLVPAPVAVITHYAAEVRVAPGSHHAVCDMGGSAVEVAVLTKTDTGFQVAEPILGSEDIGGNEFDRALTEHLGRRLGDAWANLDATDRRARRQLEDLRDRSRAAKERLSRELDAEVEVRLGDERKEVRLTRGEYDELVGPIVDRALDLLEEGVTTAKRSFADLAGVVLAGGSSRTPLVAARLSERFGVLPLLHGDPRYAACLGAAITAAASGGMVQRPPTARDFRGVPAEPVLGRRPARTTPGEAVPEPVDEPVGPVGAETAGADGGSVVDRKGDPDAAVSVDPVHHGLVGLSDRSVLDVALVPTVEPIRRRVTPIKVVPVVIEEMEEAPVVDRRLVVVAAVVVAALLALVVVLSVVG